MVVFVINRDYMVYVLKYILHKMQIKLKILRKLILNLIQFYTLRTYHYLIKVK